MASKRERLRLYITERVYAELDELRKKPKTLVVKYEMLLRVEIIRNILLENDAKASDKLSKLRKDIGYAKENVVTKFALAGIESFSGVSTFLNIYSLYRLYMDNANIDDAPIKFINMDDGYHVKNIAFEKMLSPNKGNIDFDIGLAPFLKSDPIKGEENKTYIALYAVTKRLSVLKKKIAGYQAVLVMDGIKRYDVVDGKITVRDRDDIPHFTSTGFFSFDHKEAVITVDGKMVTDVLSGFVQYLESRIKVYEQQLECTGIRKE